MIIVDLHINGFRWISIPIVFGYRQKRTYVSVKNGIKGKGGYFIFKRIDKTNKYNYLKVADRPHWDQQKGGKSKSVEAHNI